MDSKSNPAYIRKTYLLPVVINLFFFIILAYIVVKSINGFVYKNKIAEAERFANSHVLRLSNSLEASKIINDLLDEKLEATIEIIIENNKDINNDFLTGLASKLNVDKIYYYNEDGKIIYTASDYLGWEAPIGTPEYEFLKGSKNFIISEIREDADSGVKIKYAQKKLKDGGFIQIGILANSIWGLTSNFCPQRLINQLVSEEDIIHAHFLDTNNNIIFCNDDEKRDTYKLSKEEKKAIYENKIYSSRNVREGVSTFEVLLPIFLDEDKVGNLLIFYSLNDLDKLVEQISIKAVIALLIMFIIYGILIVQISKKNTRIENLAYYNQVLGEPNKNYFKQFMEEKLQIVSKKKAVLFLSLENISLAKLVYGEDKLDKFFKEQISQLRKLDVSEKIFSYDEDSFFIYVYNGTYNQDTKTSIS